MSHKVRQRLAQLQFLLAKHGDLGSQSQSDAADESDSMSDNIGDSLSEKLKKRKFSQSTASILDRTVNCLRNLKRQKKAMGVELKIQKTALSGARQVMQAALNSALHARWFLNTSEPRVLLPINVTATSTFIDCNESYAELVQVTRHDILEGKLPITQLVKSHTLERLAWAMPVLLLYGAMECHNVPCVLVCDMLAMIIYEDGSTGLQRPVLSSTAAVVPSSVSPSESVRRPKYIQVIGLGQQRSPTTDLVTVVFPLHPQVVGVSFEYPCINPALDEPAGPLGAFHVVDRPSAVANVPMSTAVSYDIPEGLPFTAPTNLGFANCSMIDFSRASCQAEISRMGNEFGLRFDVDQARTSFMTATSIDPAAATGSVIRWQTLLPMLTAAAVDRSCFTPAQNADGSVALASLYPVGAISSVPPPSDINDVRWMASFVSSDQSPGPKHTEGNDVPLANFQDVSAAESTSNFGAGVEVSSCTPRVVFHDIDWIESRGTELPAAVTESPSSFPRTLRTQPESLVGSQTTPESLVGSQTTRDHTNSESYSW